MDEEATHTSCLLCALAVAVAVRGGGGGVGGGGRGEGRNRFHAIQMAMNAHTKEDGLTSENTKHCQIL